MNLSCVHSGGPGGLCTPCSLLAAPGWDRPLHCCWAAALCGGHGRALRAGRAWHSRSKSSSRSQHSPELDVDTHIVGDYYRISSMVANNQTAVGLKRCWTPKFTVCAEVRLLSKSETLQSSCRLHNYSLPVKQCNGAKYSGNNWRSMKHWLWLVELGFPVLLQVVWEHAKWATRSISKSCDFSFHFFSPCSMTKLWCIKHADLVTTGL